MPLEWGFLIGRAIQTLQIQAPEATLQTKLIVEMAPAMEVNPALFALLIAVLVQIILGLQIPIIPAVQAIIALSLTALLLKTIATVTTTLIAQVLTIVSKVLVLMHALGLAKIMKTSNKQEWNGLAVIQKTENFLVALCQKLKPLVIQKINQWLMHRHFFALLLAKYV